jgi:hypothetical protein
VTSDIAIFWSPRLRQTPAIVDAIVPG